MYTLYLVKQAELLMLPVGILLRQGILIYRVSQRTFQARIFLKAVMWLSHRWQAEPKHQ